MVNRGTREGDEEEISFVQLLNKKVDLHFWEVLNLNPENHFGIRVKSFQPGKISGRKVKPKADVYIAKGEVPQDYLETNDFYLDEDDVLTFDLEPLAFTGISVKLQDSRSFQIAKMSPNVFKKIFGSYELGAGASIYSDDEEGFVFNPSIIERWKITENDFFKFFKLKKIKSTSELNVDSAKKIKDFSNEKIMQIINENKEVADYIFQGIGNFEEPYTVHYLYKNGELKNDCYIPFRVTHGSGRSSGKPLSIEIHTK